MKKKLTPHQRIMRAYNDPNGVRGIRLSADEVMELGRDGAIETCALNDDEADEERASDPEGKSKP